MYLNFYYTLPLKDGSTPLYKELIPPALSRRMKPLLKNGVYAALKVVDQLAEGIKIDGVLTATGLGAMKDTVDFANQIDEDETLLSPTPFIQSTHNTLGGQIALLRSLNGYNNTHIHHYLAFHNALIEADVLLNYGGHKNLLVGYAEDGDDCVSKWYENTFKTKGEWNSAAGFMHLSAEKLPSTIAQITRVEELPLDELPQQDVLVFDIAKEMQEKEYFHFSIAYQTFLEAITLKKYKHFVLSFNQRAYIISMEYI